MVVVSDNYAQAVADELAIDYQNHDRVQLILDQIVHILESISLDFDRWDEPFVRGPGLYFAIVSGHSVSNYADPMGDNTWPTEDCQTIIGCEESFYEAALEVAETRDGAVVVSVDGHIQPQMVRFRDVDTDEIPTESKPEYTDWMGSRHMSAADTSLRPNVVAAVTLSEETGRVTVFTDGGFDDQPRHEISARWRND